MEARSASGSGYPGVFDHVARGYLAALQKGDAGEAIALVDEFMAEGLSYEDLCLQVVQPAMREIGRLWQQNEMSIAQEHVATAITQTVLAKTFTPKPSHRPGRTIMASCTPGELHGVGLRMLADFAQLRGWASIYLGTDVPTRDLIGVVKDREPDVLALSTSVPINLSEARACFEAINKLPERPLIVAGGIAYRGRAATAISLGADVFARDAHEFAEELDARFPA